MGPFCPILNDLVMGHGFDSQRMHCLNEMYIALYECINVIIKCILSVSASDVFDLKDEDIIEVRSFIFHR